MRIVGAISEPNVAGGCVPTLDTVCGMASVSSSPHPLRGGDWGHWLHGSRLRASRLLFRIWSVWRSHER